jgi:sugar O-acyltransferase (sialic acid O-acetyltransferase NeuD family)
VNVYLLGAKNPETQRQLAAQQQANSAFRPVGFLDNDPQKWGTSFLGLPVIGGASVVPTILQDDPDAHFVNLITGSTLARHETSVELHHLGCRFTNLVHPSVDLTGVEMGVGNYIQDGVILQAGVQIGDNSSIHVGAIVAHESTVGSSCFVAHACSISGEVRIGDGTFVGTNSTIIPRRDIGAWATIGAGSVVTKDVAAGTTVVGSPARVVREHEGPLPSEGALSFGPPS